MNLFIRPQKGVFSANMSENGPIGTTLCLEKFFKKSSFPHCKFSHYPLVYNYDLHYNKIRGINNNFPS